MHSKIKEAVFIFVYYSSNTVTLHSNQTDQLQLTGSN